MAEIIDTRDCRIPYNDHEYKGQQHLIASGHADVLSDLAELALVRSIESSNKIERIYTSDERLKKSLWTRRCQRQEMSAKLQGIGMSCI